MLLNGTWQMTALNGFASYELSEGSFK